MKTCPNCGEKISLFAKFCNKCGCNFADYKKKTDEEPEEKPAKCPNCGKKLSAKDAFCPKCGKKVELEYDKKLLEICNGVLTKCRDKKVKSLQIPDGITAIGKGAFWGCYDLTDIKIPESVTSIGFSAFSGCRALTGVEIPAGVTEIESFAFSGCSGLSEIKIPDGVTVIGARAFENCSGLTSIFIPENVAKIGERAFRECSGVTSITVDKNNAAYKSKDNCLLTKDGKTLIFGCKTSTVPRSVTVIGKMAFYKCSGLTNIIIPDGVTEICERAFDECGGLTSVEIPHDCTVAYKAFPETCNVIRREKKTNHM